MTYSLHVKSTVNIACAMKIKTVHIYHKRNTDQLSHVISSRAPAEARVGFTYGLEVRSCFWIQLDRSKVHSQFRHFLTGQLHRQLRWWLFAWPEMRRRVYRQHSPQRDENIPRGCFCLLKNPNTLEPKLYPFDWSVLVVGCCAFSVDCLWWNFHVR
jgi:hypothetical protein